MEIIVCNFVMNNVLYFKYSELEMTKMHPRKEMLIAGSEGFELKGK